MKAIVDGNNVATAAFSVSKQLMNSKGVYTGTTLTTIDMMRTMLRTFPNIDQVIFAWDSYPTWRHQMFPEYKGTRTHSSSRDEFDWPGQKAQLQSCLPWFGVAQVEAELMEADDIAGQWAAKSEHPELLFVSNDRDWLQFLRRPGITIYRTVDKRVVTMNDFESMTECRDIEEYVSMKAITGESGDNIPGIVGVGPKKALAFLRGEMKAGAVKDKINAWVADPNGYGRSRKLFELGVPYYEGSGVATMTPPQYNEGEIRRIITDFEATKRLSYFEDFVAPFKRLKY